jgi:hypothetical protein
VPAESEGVAGIVAAMRFEAVYGFVDEYGDRWHWERGQIIRNPFVIKMLLKRRAPVEIIERRSQALKQAKE